MAIEQEIQTRLRAASALSAVEVLVPSDVPATKEFIVIRPSVGSIALGTLTGGAYASNKQFDIAYAGPVENAYAVEQAVKDALVGWCPSDVISFRYIASSPPQPVSEKAEESYVIASTSFAALTATTV